MSTQNPDQETVRDQELTRQLESLLGHQLTRIRGRFFLHGLGILLFAALGFAIIYYMVDRLLTLPQSGRSLSSRRIRA